MIKPFIIELERKSMK